MVSCVRILRSFTAMKSVMSKASRSPNRLPSGSNPTVNNIPAQAAKRSSIRALFVEFASAVDAVRPSRRTVEDVAQGE